MSPTRSNMWQYIPHTYAPRTIRARLNRMRSHADCDENIGKRNMYARSGYRRINLSELPMFYADVL